MNIGLNSNERVVVDSKGRSPWVGRARSFAEYKQLDLPIFEDPFTEAPDGDVTVPGINGIDGFPTEFRLGKELWLPGHGYLYREALSCSRTTLNARMRAAIQYIKENTEISSGDAIYMTEMVTPMFEFVRSQYGTLTGSEYLPNIPLGTFSDGVRCEDLQALTFDDSSFDLVLSFDVLEHVPEYKIGIHEMARVLKPGGTLILTAPAYLEGENSHLRAIINREGNLQHLLPPEYHGNPLGPPSLCFTSFGFNLVEDLRKYGFKDSFAQFYSNVEMGYWGQPQVLYIATR